MTSDRRRLLLLPTLAALACAGGEGPGAPASVVRDSLPDGTVVVRYGALPDRAERTAVEELRIGAMDGDPPYVFGDVRGIEADERGVIYVLDHQASEIRTFEPDGTYRETIATAGEGPGELLRANGMILMGDSILWVQDHAQWRLIGLSLDGQEARRVPMHVLNYGFMWNGTVDPMGRFWKPAQHSDAPFPRDPGFHESQLRSYLVSLDLETEATDSVFLGAEIFRSHVSTVGETGWRVMQIPHDARAVTVVDPSSGFWRTDGGTYRIARLDETGDTVLVIEADAVGAPVTDADADDFREQANVGGTDFDPAVEEVIDAIPERKPAITGLVVDDEGRLWVRRSGAANAPTRYDVFARDGSWVTGVELGFEPNRFLPLRIRSGKIYALVHDELDVPFVVRATLR